MNLKVEGSSVKQTYELRLKEWKWTSQFVEGNIVSLVATDQDGKERFNYNSSAKPLPPKKLEPTPKKAEGSELPWMNETQFQEAKTFILEGKAKPDFMETVSKKYRLRKEYKDKLNELVINAPEIIQ